MACVCVLKPHFAPCGDNLPPGSFHSVEVVASPTDGRPMRQRSPFRRYSSVLHKSCWPIVESSEVDSLLASTFAHSAHSSSTSCQPETYQIWEHRSLEVRPSLQKKRLEVHNLAQLTFMLMRQSIAVCSESSETHADDSAGGGPNQKSLQVPF